MVGCSSRTPIQGLCAWPEVSTPAATTSASVALPAQARRDHVPSIALFYPAPRRRGIGVALGLERCPALAGPRGQKTFFSHPTSAWVTAALTCLFGSRPYSSPSPVLLEGGGGSRRGP